MSSTATAGFHERRILRRYTTTSPEETSAVAAEFSGSLKAGTIVALTGDLGAGKTVFVKAVAAALGVQEELTSPTYNLVAEYPGTPQVVHMDLYRLTEVSEFELLGVEDILEGDAVTLIEWADRAKPALPQDRTVWVRILFGDGDRRTIEIEVPNDE